MIRMGRLFSNTLASRMLIRVQMNRETSTRNKPRTLIREQLSFIGLNSNRVVRIQMEATKPAPGAFVFSQAAQLVVPHPACSGPEYQQLWLQMQARRSYRHAGAPSKGALRKQIRHAVVLLQPAALHLTSRWMTHP